MNLDIIEQVENNNPVLQITDSESELIFLKLGSFLSIINNKKLNQAKLLVMVLNDPDFQKCFLELTDIDNLQELVQCFIKKYPTISKSKVVFSSIVKKHKKHKEKRNDSAYVSRKKSI